MKPEDAEEYTATLGAHFGASYRQIGLGERLGAPKALGLTTEEWVKSRLGGYVKLTIKDRRAAVLELTTPVEEGGQGLNNTQAAAVLGVSDQTVRRAKSTNVEPTPKRKRHTSTNVEQPTHAEVEAAVGDELPDEPEMAVQVSTKPRAVVTDDEVQSEVLASIKKVNAILAHLADADVGGLGFWPEGMVMAVRDHIKDTIEAAYRLVEKYNAALDEPQIRVVQ